MQEECGTRNVAPTGSVNMYCLPFFISISLSYSIKCYCVVQISCLRNRFIFLAVADHSQQSYY